MPVPPQPYVVQNGHPLEKLYLLKSAGYAQLRTLVRFEVVNSAAVEIDIAFLWTVETGNTIYHDGFAGAVWSYYGMDLSFFHLEADVIKRPDFSEIHGQTFNLE